MLKSIALAGVTAALVLGSLAIAQTTGDTSANGGAANNGQAVDNGGPSGAGAADANGSAASANTYGNNAAANTGAGAGERG